MTNLHEKGKYKQKVQYNFLSIFATLLNHIEEEQKPFIHPVDISDNTLLFLQKKNRNPRPESENCDSYPADEQKRLGLKGNLKITWEQ